MRSISEYCDFVKGSFKSHKEMVDYIVSNCPIGSAVISDGVHKEFLGRNIPDGTKGNIVRIEDNGDLIVSWENGDMTKLIPFLDEFSVVEGLEYLG